MNTDIRIGGLPIGRIPKVVGSISRYETLQALLLPRDPVCDLFEVRLDQIGLAHADWLARCRALESGGLPVILTVRSADEGGRWDGSDADRMAIFDRALRVLATVDVEAASGLCAPVCDLAAELGKPVILSFHDFEKTPPLSELRDRVAAMGSHPHAIPKLATLITSTADVDVLSRLLAENLSRPICLIGMGPMGRECRVALATQGSCLTYGYMDQTAAPGQWPAGDLFSALRASMPRYNEYAIAQHKMHKTDWRSH